MYLEEQPSIEIELIQDIEPIGKYNKSGIVNHLAFTVEDINIAINHYQKKGVKFSSPQPQPILEGGRMILFYGPHFKQELEVYIHFNNHGRIKVKLKRCEPSSLPGSCPQCCLIK